MAYEQKEGDIVIYAVKEKTNERGPDWTGKALVNGEEKQVSFWIKSDTMLAGQIKDKYKPDFQGVKDQVSKSDATYGKATKGLARDEMEDDIPFMRLGKIY